MMLAGDRLIVQNNYGSVLVARLGEDLPELLAQMKPFRRLGKDWTVPVLANGKLYCRSGRERKLACFDVSN